MDTKEELPIFLSCICENFTSNVITKFIIVNTQNILNLIGQEEHIIYRKLLSATVLYSLKNKTTFEFRSRKSKHLSMKNRSIMNYSLKTIFIHDQLVNDYQLVIN